MKISALENKYGNSGVTVMELVDVDFPLETIIELGLGCPSTLTIPGIHWTRKFDNASHVENGKPGPISYIDDAGERHHLAKGLVFYGAFSELVDFVVNKVPADGEGDLSEAVRKLTTINGQVNKEMLETRLGMPANYLSGKYLPLRKSLPIEQQSANYTSKYAPITREGRQVWAWRLSRGMYDYVLAARQDYRRMDGHDIPFYRMLKPLQGFSGRPDRSTHMDFMVYDGEICSWSRSLEEVPEGFLHEIDDQGTLYQISDFDILPMEHVVPVCAIRIPGQEEMKGLIKEAGSFTKKDVPPHPLLKSCGLTFDSHYPIPLRDSIEIIDDPRAALWFLSRTVRGIFTPGKVPSMFPVKLIPENESYQILTRPKRMFS